VQLDVLKNSEVTGMESELDKESYEKSKGLVIQPYGNRYYALYDGEDLVCVTVYKKGALEVKRRLETAFDSMRKET
jgi:hypothetical protein